VGVLQRNEHMTFLVEKIESVETMQHNLLSSRLCVFARFGCFACLLWLCYIYMVMYDHDYVYDLI
jgi:hypothetical protein